MRSRSALAAAISGWGLMHESSTLVMEATGTARAKLDMELIAAPALRLSALIIGRTPREAVLADILWH